MGGTNTAIYAGDSYNYTYRHTASGVTISTKSNTQLQDTLMSIQKIQFDDKTVDLAIPSDAETVDLKSQTVADDNGQRRLAANTTIIGSNTNDTFFADPGDGSWNIDGADGSDTLVMRGTGFTQAQVTVSGAGAFTATLTNATIHASNVEQISFIDGTDEFDVNSPAAQVMRLYQSALGRAPDPAGLAVWAYSLQAGRSLDSIASGFLASAEFQARFGAGDNGGFVTQLYQNVLGRAPDTAGYADWLGALNGGVTRSSVLLSFSESAENKANTAPALSNGLWVPDQMATEVARLYYTTFGRAPDAGGLQAWTGALKGGVSLEQEANGFMASAEFQQKYGGIDNPAFVDALYRNALGRPADANGEAAWTNALNAGALTRAQVVVRFSESPEHQASLMGVVDTHGIVLA